MKYFVIRPKNEDVRQDILRMLEGRNKDARDVEWTEVPDPRQTPEDVISVHMFDGVSFMLSYDPNHLIANAILSAVPFARLRASQSAKSVSISRNNKLSMEPSTSTETKRAIDDTDSKAKSPNEQEKVSLEPIQCQKCGETFPSDDFSTSIAKEHAATHEKRFKCGVRRCNFRSYWMYKVKKHFESDHKNCQHLKYKFKMTPEHKTEWMQHVKDCFPEVDENPRKKCKYCPLPIPQEDWKLREHVLKEHLKNFTTAEQENELAEKMKDCFSDED